MTFPKKCANQARAEIGSEFAARSRPALTRRAFLRRSALAGSLLASLAAGRKEGRRKAAGTVPDLSPFDRAMRRFMEARRVPGGALAVVKDGRLVYARGYGLADRERGIVATPRTRFRIASLTKPITGVAIMKLVQAGRLDLDAKAFAVLDFPPPAATRERPDPRWAEITVRQLLHHTAGWDRKRSFDPMFRLNRIAQALGVPRPPGPRAVIRYLRGRPLDFAPGTQYAYSNFGYCVLGRVIEAISGRPYEQFVRSEVLEPLGVTAPRIGHSLPDRRAPGEARYYVPEEEAKVPSVFAERPGKVPQPDGGFCLKTMDSHGGWIASVVDLARFAAALDAPGRRPLLRPEFLRQLYGPPAPPVARTNGKLNPSFYGLGWMVRPQGAGRANYWHVGSLPGTHALLVRRWDGLSWAALFNQRSEDPRRPDGALDPALHRAADAVQQWPEGDRFGTV